MKTDETAAPSPVQVRDPQLAASQVTAALQALPPAAIRSFGIGNEPDLYM